MKILISLILLCLFTTPLLAAEMTAQELKADGMRDKCNADPVMNLAFDCECVGDKITEAYNKDGSGDWGKAYLFAFMHDARKCADAKQIHAETMKNCQDKYSVHQHRDRKKLGQESFCQCVADTTVKRLDTATMDRIIYLPTEFTTAMGDCGR